MKILTSSLVVFASGALGISLAVSCATGADQRSVGQMAVERAGTDLEGSGLCAILQQLEEDCPFDLEWDNHGQYVSCVARYLTARAEMDDVNEDELEGLVAKAARSTIGLPEVAKRGRRTGAGAAGGGGGAPGVDELGSPFADETRAACGTLE